MRREYPLPPGFEGLTGKVNYVQKRTVTEYSSSCPKCGGNVHANGEWPDRFRMFTTGKVRGWCRQCDFNWYPDLEEDWRPNAEEIAARAKAAEESLQREIQRAQVTLEEMRQARMWLEYHDNLTGNARAVWRMRGLSDTFIDYWQLGYSDTFTLWRKNGEFWEDWWNTATLTIPIWDNGWQVNNIKHRLLDVPPNGPKYQQERRGIPAAPFVCEPDRDDGFLLICEGEIKAMVTFQTIDSPDVQIVGMPTVTPSQDMIDRFTEYDPVYICLDPDAYLRPNKDTKAPIERLVNLFGNKKVKVIELPYKIDDLILAGSLDKAGIKRAMRRARRL